MESVLTYFLTTQDTQTFNLFNQKFKSFFTKRNKNFDASIDFLLQFFNSYGSLPTYQVAQEQLSLNNEHELLNYIKASAESGYPSTAQNLISHVLKLKTIYLDQDVNDAMQQFAIDRQKSDVGLLPSIDNIVVNLYELKRKASEQGRQQSGLLYGKSAIEESISDYEKIKDAKNSSEVLYYDLGYSSWPTVQMTPGDLVYIGGFTSHGKSIQLRQMIYLFAVKYGKNTALISFEMSYKKLKHLFGILHANNKEIFPGTPIINSDKYKHGQLSDEEEDFLFNIAIPDLFNNEAYGTIFIESPDEMKFNIIDLQLKMRELESQMPITLLGLDYAAQMHPLLSKERSAQRSDYNQLFDDLKKFAMNYTDMQNNLKPIILISPVQLSRQGLDNALKNDNLYTMSAIQEFSGIDKSGDIIFTILATEKMRDANQAFIQALKNRDGGVPSDSTQLFIDYKNGFTLSELTQQSDEDITAAIQSIDI